MPDKASDKRQSAIDKGVKRVFDRRRFKTTAVPTGEVKVEVDSSKKGTIFPERVQNPRPGEAVLKEGRWNSKIGGDVLVGHLRGAKILTLTLEERATCPRSCELWTRCYGNGMHYSTRYRLTPALLSRIREELTDWCSKEDAVLVRLHILGDFATFDYLAFWVELLDFHDNLYVFGFTAWGEDTKIGAGIKRVREAMPGRFCIRHSGRSGPWGSFTIDFPTERKRLGDVVVCPEQRDAMNGHPRKTHCGSCAVCWSTDRPIAFVEH